MKLELRNFVQVFIELSLEGCFNGGKERGREKERGEHEIEGIKEDKTKLCGYFKNAIHNN